MDIDENGPLMLSDKILCIKAFDAIGTDTTGSHGRGYDGGSDRKKYGSNYWGDSNIRCWLNSTASAGNVVWTCGNPPVSDKVWNQAQYYAHEAGFLNQFTKNELKLIKNVYQKQILDGYEYKNNKC